MEKSTYKIVGLNYSDKEVKRTIKAYSADEAIDKFLRKNQRYDFVFVIDNNEEKLIAIGSQIYIY